MYRGHSTFNAYCTFETRTFFFERPAETKHRNVIESSLILHLHHTQGSDLPIYIWYESYPEHIEEGYKGRVSRVSQDSPFGSASLNLTNIRESDQGWYECKVVFLNRDPKQHKNGTWFHLDVHAPPRFSVTPEDIIYVNLGKWELLLDATISAGAIAPCPRRSLIFQRETIAGYSMLKYLRIQVMATS